MFLLLFFDDILIYSKTWEEHPKHLDEILSILEEHSLYVKMSKCEFGMKEMLYLGHIINAEGVQVDMEKIRCQRLACAKNNYRVERVLGFVHLLPTVR